MALSRKPPQSSTSSLHSIVSNIQNFKSENCCSLQNVRTLQRRLTGAQLSVVWGCLQYVINFLTTRKMKQQLRTIWKNDFNKGYFVFLCVLKCKYVCSYGQICACFYFACMDDGNSNKTEFASPFFSINCTQIGL
jgi:hypothetical protein